MKRVAVLLAAVVAGLCLVGTASAAPAAASPTRTNAVWRDTGWSYKYLPACKAAGEGYVYQGASTYACQKSDYPGFAYDLWVLD